MADPPPAPTPAEIYERAFVSAIFAPLTRLVIPLAALALGERVLDLACGTGVVSRAAAPLVGAEGRLVGVDLRPGMIAVARNLPAPAGAAIEWVVGDALALDLADDAFDVVICQQGFQFFDDQMAAARGIHRVLRPGGRLVAAVWQTIENQPLLHGLTEIERRYLGPLGVTDADLELPFRFGDRAALTTLLTTAGFLEVDVEVATIETAFAADTFVPDVEYAYAGMVPAFLEDPGAHAWFVASVERDAGDLIERFRDGTHVRSPMSTFLVRARTQD